MTEKRGTMKVQCCRCKADMGTKECCIENDGQVSHGYCPECEKVVRAEIEAMRD